MGPYGQFDEGIARSAAPSRALAAQPDGLAIYSPHRDRGIDGLAIAKGNALLTAENGVFQIDVELGAYIRALGGKGATIAEPAASAAAGASTARSEHVTKDVV